MLNIIVFSRDRACQLELFIRSMKFYFKEFYQYNINVLYTYSNNKFKEGYEKLFKISKMLSGLFFFFIDQLRRKN